MRAMATRARVMTIIIDLVWNALVPRGIPLWAVQSCLVVAGIAKALRASLAFGLLPSLGIPFTPTVAFTASLAAGAFIAPVHQIGALDVLATGRSPARYRIMSWITMEAAAMGVLIAPHFMASPPVVLFLTLMPVVLVMLRLESDMGPLTRAGVRDVLPVDVIGISTAEAKRSSTSNDDAETLESSKDGSVPVPEGLILNSWHAGVFIALSLLGTSGEALNDVATVRDGRHEIMFRSLRAYAVLRTSMICSHSDA